jgi:hypothetical protein
MLRVGLLAMAIVSGASAQTRLPSFGGTGGTPFATACPALQYLRGLELRTADDVDAARPICGRVGADGRISGDLPIGPWRGGTGGEVRSILCPTQRPVVVGARVGAEGRNTYIVNSIELFCSRPDDVERPEWEDVGDIGFHAQSLPRSAYDSGIIVKFYTAAQYKMEVCPPGQLASGIHGQHGIWLDRLGFTCVAAPPSSARTGNTFRRSAPQGQPRPPCVAAKSARQSVAFQKNSTAMATLTQRCLASIPNSDRGRCGQAKREQGAPRFAALYKLCLDSQPDS